MDDIYNLSLKMHSMEIVYELGLGQYANIDFDRYSIDISKVGDIVDRYIDRFRYIAGRYYRRYLSMLNI